MKKIVPMLFIGGCLLASLSQCTKDKAPLPTPVVVTPVCDSTKVLYCNKVKTIIDGNCTSIGCHNTGASLGDFTTLAGMSTVIANGRFNQRVILNQDMPASAPLSAADIATLTEWLNTGHN